MYFDPQNFCASFNIRNVYLGFLSIKPIKILL